MHTGLDEDSSTTFLCKECGHNVRNHFAENSPIRKHCIENGCRCNWVWDGNNETKPATPHGIEGSEMEKGISTPIYRKKLLPQVST
jgi:hypothetical protein